ncbi:MAG: cysteine hydrolase [Alphaproteobacteria bacterium]|jgi:ureidoacrylate peracid hydrolase|nr:cysteine hydrolase [Alphaproteobacteria bacterium]
MHDVGIRQEVVDRVIARRGRLHLFDHLEPSRTAFVVIDMQNTFLKPGAPVEVPRGRDIVPNINRLAAALRRLGVSVIWMTHANSSVNGASDWSNFFDHFVADDVRRRTIEGLEPGADGQQIWPDLIVEPGDVRMFKNRYSALISGSSSLERLLRSQGLDTLLIAGTKTNVCCESTGRDAMMLDFKTVMLSDCCAALSDEEHQASLETFIQQFGDVMTADEALAALAT